jgi:hypothetical protein
MTRALVTIRCEEDRLRASRWALRARPGMRIEFKEAKRTVDQNARMWAMLTDVASQLPWHGMKLTPDDWKILFLDALKREIRAIPNLNGDGFVNLGKSSSDLTRAEMSDLMELISAFGTSHGVTFHDDQEDSNSTEPAQSPQDSQDRSDKPEASLPSSVSGNQSSATPARADEDGSGASPPTPLPSLPEGWEITYAAALRRAQKPISLDKLASQWWATHGGWETHKNGPNATTAAAIYTAFKTNFGNKDAIERDLREIF